ncbi:MAG: GNAT family N-acetyltransferase [Candidatus Hydrogenedentes bacterium]|nr:GNAT family N-acetyltransferase [Candidatus Hydrogenedentota bacterium]
MLQTRPADRKLPTVRPLKDGDEGEWLRLRLALWPNHTCSELEENMAGIRANPEGEVVFVAECGEGKLCGMVEVSIRKTARGCRTDRVGYLEGWFVDPEWRCQGVGRKLVEAGESWCRAHGCIEMASDTTSAYPLSPAAHRRLGYQDVEDSLHFRKDLT